jgi:hypothetical protein
MTKDPNMQHMTMKEYVSIAMLGEYAVMPSMVKAIDEGIITPRELIENCFRWADLWMMVREERNAKT